MTGRALLVTAAALLLSALACLFAAGANWRAPLLPERVEQFDIRALQQFGSKQADGPGDAVWFTGADESARSLLMARDLQLAAEEWQFLVLRFARFPADLRVSLIWRSSEAPERLQSQVLARPGRQAAHVRLADIDGWGGTITELGLLVFPANLLAAETTAERRFALAGFSLESDSTGAALASLVTEVTAYRPWVGRSINTAGFEVASSRPYAMVMLVAVLVLIAGLAARLVLVPSVRRSWLPLGLALLVGWLVLDLHLLAQLFWRGEFTRQADLRGNELQVDVALNEGLTALRSKLVERDIRLAMVGATLPFYRTYGAFRLLPLPSVATQVPPSTIAADDRLALVLIGRGDWQHDPSARSLRWADNVYRVDVLHSDAQLAAFRLLEKLDSEVTP